MSTCLILPRQVSPTDILTLTSGCCTRAPPPATLQQPQLPPSVVDNHEDKSGSDTNGNTARFTDGPPVRRHGNRGPLGATGFPSGAGGPSLRNHEIKGSDSGISMTSQDVQDMFDLLQQQLPFDMPKLRRKMVSANSSR